LLYVLQRRWEEEARRLTTFSFNDERFIERVASDAATSSSGARVSATHARPEVYTYTPAFVGGLEEDPRRSRERSAKRRLAVGDHSHKLIGGRLRVHSRPDSDDKVVALLHRDELLDFDDARLRVEKCPNRSPRSRRRAFANQEALDFDCKPEATTINNVPMAMLPTAS